MELLNAQGEPVNMVDVINQSIQREKRINESFDTNLISDGYHTFGELYEHRIALFIALCKSIEGQENDAWRLPPNDGWFIMGIGKEKGKQITYHLPECKWGETSFCQTTTDSSYEFDGHTSADVLERLKQL